MCISLTILSLFYKISDTYAQTSLPVPHIQVDKEDGK